MPWLSGHQPSERFIRPLRALGISIACGHSSFYLKGEGEAAVYKAASTPVLIPVCLQSQQQIRVPQNRKSCWNSPMCQGCLFCQCQYHGSGLKFGDARKPMCIHFKLNVCFFSPFPPGYFCSWCQICICFVRRCCSLEQFVLTTVLSRISGISKPQTAICIISVDKQLLPKKRQTLPVLCYICLNLPSFLHTASTFFQKHPGSSALHFTNVMLKHGDF